ncbi:MAG: hypothetical protein E4H14_10030 [Candidatus Thorarchaeota archaeon]|nr:MAG: hypothetical protein E4H14_10030 [Candidatus Thorarchaeota archaeon]
MSNDEIEMLEDIESYSPSVQNINTVINVVAALHIFSGIIAIPIAYLLFSAFTFQVPLIIVITILIVEAVLITSIPLYFIISWAIWSLQSWAWKVAIIANVIFLILNLIGGIILPALLNIVFLFALFGSDVKLALIPLND